MTEATISLPFPISVNAMYANSKERGHRGRRKTLQYVQWQTEAGWMIKAARVPSFKGPVRIAYVFQVRSGRYDLSNFIKAIEDLLVTHGVIEDDNSKIIRRFTVSQSMECKGVLVHLASSQEDEE